jgi:hypothetical protein
MVANTQTQISTAEEKFVDQFVDTQLNFDDLVAPTGRMR